MPDHKPVDIAPSILAADPLHMGRDVQLMLDAGARVLHLDIMDGHFVPNLSFGPAIVAALKSAYPHIRRDVHLMVEKPEGFFDAFIQAGAQDLTFHVEASEDVASALRYIKSQGVNAGLSIKPGTDANSLFPYLQLVDLILVMSVEPGFGGQSLMLDALEKLPILRQAGFQGVLSVDGGVSQQNAALVISKGASRLVMGTAAFRSEDPKALFARFQSNA